MLLKLCKQKRKEKQTLELKMRYKKRCLYHWITLLSNKSWLIGL